MERTVKLDIAVASKPEDVWEVLGPFDALPRWNPAYAESTLSQDSQGRTIRTSKLSNGLMIVDRLLEHSDEARFYRYKHEKSPIPLEYMDGELMVFGTGDESRIQWTLMYEIAAGAPEEVMVPRVEWTVKQAEANLISLFGAV